MEELYSRAREAFHHWEKVKDLVDELIDLMLNHRQSGHPGGSRSKVHAFLATLLSGAMRWDILRPWRPLCDRFILSAGHTVPLVYATLAVLNEAMRTRFEFPDGGRYALTWEDLLTFRRRGGLPGHAEAAGKTLFLKYNTGPSGHGLPAAAGQALALRMADAGDVRVFAMEGEGGLTPGAAHETKNSAWGLGLSNLVVLVDWNDYGIDSQRISDVVHGTPREWFEPYGWRVFGTEKGSEFPGVTRSILEASRSPNPDGVPSVSWHRTRKGRGYGKYDHASHGAPHPRNSPEFWKVRERFMEKYGVEYDRSEGGAEANFRLVMEVLLRDGELVDYLSGRLVELAGEVPERTPGANPSDLEWVHDFRNYPASMYARPGERLPNRVALGRWGAWVNCRAREELKRPLIVACSADLAESTNIAGFADGFEGSPGWGRYHRRDNVRGTLLPQEITEFANAGIVTGLAAVNLAEDPRESFDGLWGACSTYGSFSYLKYGPMRLFSQLAQDSETKTGKVIWVAGHSGPETAEDSRTHFGIHATGVTQMFPEGHAVDLHPWEHNEVPVVLGAALALDAPIVVLHLTRPPIEIPDREALGISSHLEAARGAYVLRPYRGGRAPMGAVFVQGTYTTANLVKALPELDREGLNVKVVAAISPQLFARQDPAYRAATASDADRWDSMCVTNRSLRVTCDWIAHPVAAEYSLSADRDNRWRTGGSVEEVMEESGLSTEQILEGIRRFVRDRDNRMRRLRELVD
jgi:transketolase